MRARSQPLRLVALAVAVALAVPVPLARAAAPDAGEPASEVERLYYEGAARYSASDYDGALESFTRALEAATRERASSRIREALLMNMAQAHVKAHALDGDDSHLRTARDIYGRLLQESEEGLYSKEVVTEARAQIDALDQQLASLQDDPLPEAGAQDKKRDRKPPSSAARGIGLLVSGGLLLGGGAGLLGHGARFKGQAEAEVDGFDDPPEAEQEFVDEETRKGKTLMGVGGGVAAVGLALLIWGAVDLARHRKHKRSSTALRGGPWLDAGLAGMSVGGRF